MSSRVRQPHTGRSNKSSSASNAIVNKSRRSSVNAPSSHNTGPTKSMAERINERLALIAASKVQKLEIDNSEEGECIFYFRPDFAFFQASAPSLTC